MSSKVAPDDHGDFIDVVPFPSRHESGLSQPPASPTPDTGHSSSQKPSRNFTLGGLAQSARFQVRSSVDNAVDFVKFLGTYKFSDPRWLVFPGVCGFVFSGIGFYLAYSQLLDAKAIPTDVLTGDVIEASRQMRNPDIITPCIDRAQSSCIPQYFGAAFFVACACVVAWLAVLALRDYCRMRRHVSACTSIELSQGQSLNDLDRTKVGVLRVDSDETNLAKVSSIFSAEFLIDSMNSITNSWMYKQSLRFSPGKELFWHRCLFTLLIEVGLQLVRCFVTDDAYAKTSGPQTLAQVILITVNVNCFMLVYYYHMELGYVATNICSEAGYLAIRLWSHGSLSMRSSSFLDFLTIAGPFCFCIYEVFEIKQFILHERQTVLEDAIAYKKSRRRRKITAILVSVLATVACVVLVVLVVQKDSVDDCPAPLLLVDTLLGKDSFFPPGVDCLLWQFNLFLTPSCSCVYLRSWTPEPCPEVDPNSTSKYLEGAMEYIQDVSFFDIELRRDCNTIHAIVDVVPTLTSLRIVSVTGFDAEELPASWSQLDRLQSLMFSFTRLESIDVEVLNSWKKLESFACRPCPLFESLQNVAVADLPRLDFVEVYGASSCADSDNLFGKMSHFRCIDNNATSVCPGMPEWFFADLVDLVQSAKRTGCYEPKCQVMVDSYYWIDKFMNKDGLMNLDEFYVLMYTMAGSLAENYVYYTIDAVFCLFEHMQQAVQVEHSLFPKSEPRQFLNAEEFLSFATAYTNCGQCELTQQLMAQGAESFSRIKLGCVDDWAFRDAMGGPCGMWKSFNCSHFDDQVASWGYTEQDLISIRESCPISCGLCDDGQQEQEAVAPSNPNCTDVEGFRDAVGYPCSGWIGYDCYKFDPEVALWGYVETDLVPIQENCKASCGLCT